MSQEPHSPWRKQGVTEPPLPKSQMLNLSEGLNRAVIVAYGAWAAGYLIWSGFFPDILLWLRNDINGFGIKWTVGKRLSDDLSVAFFWPAIVIGTAWVVFYLVAPVIIWIVYRIVRWVAAGFKQDGDQK